jgi:hypothetical protein
MSDIIEFKPQYVRAYNVEYVQVTDILNTPVIIKDFIIDMFNDREVAEILAEDLNNNEFAFRTSSKVIIKQLKQYEREIKMGKKLKCKIVKRKRYYTLAPP